MTRVNQKTWNDFPADMSKNNVEQMYYEITCDP